MSERRNGYTDEKGKTMSGDEKLKPCPSCGGKVNVTSVGRAHWYMFDCQGCEFAATMSLRTYNAHPRAEDFAAGKWNYISPHTTREEYGCDEDLTQRQIAYSLDGEVLVRTCCWCVFADMMFHYRDVTRGFAFIAYAEIHLPTMLVKINLSNESK